MLLIYMNINKHNIFSKRKHETYTSLAIINWKK